MDHDFIVFASVHALMWHVALLQVRHFGFLNVPWNILHSSNFIGEILNEVTMYLFLFEWNAFAANAFEAFHKFTDVLFCMLWIFRVEVAMENGFVKR